LSICGDLIAALDADTGAICRLRYGSLDAVMRIAFEMEQYDYCAAILLQQRRLIRHLSPAGLSSLAAMDALLPRKLTDFNVVRRRRQYAGGKDSFVPCSGSESESFGRIQI
jgi:hypothetical protein